MARHKIESWLRIGLIIAIVSALLTPHLVALKDRPKSIRALELLRIRELVIKRDKAVEEYLLATKGLDIALAYLYQEYAGFGIGRLTHDIDLETGEFIAYRNGRAPNMPPTFVKYNKGKDQ